MYFDYAATTPVLKEIKDKACQLLTKYENPSSLHIKSKEIKGEIELARDKVAAFLNTTPDHIFFTSGATESNNTVIKGFYFNNKEVKQHYFTSLIEHPSVIEPIEYLNGFDNFTSSYVSLQIILNPYELEKEVLFKSPTFASFMMANNETGTIFPIKKIASILTKHGVYLHVDATQAIGKINIDVQDLDVDSLSFSGHKIFAPKGIGVLYLKDPSSVTPLIHGGGQEKGLRCGTENVFNILALKIAINYFNTHFTEIQSHYKKCRSRFLDKLNAAAIEYILNETDGLVNIISIRFSMKGDALADILNFKYGTMISVGSACSSNKNEKKLSHVLKNYGLMDHEIQKTTRISFGPETSLADIDELVKNINNVLSVYH